MSQQPRWFEPGSQVHAKKNAEVIRREHESFKKKALRALKIGKKRDVTIASSKDELERQISGMLGQSSGAGSPGPSSLVLQEMEGATKAHEAYQDQRLAGGKMVASAMQRRLDDFAQFVGAFDGLMEKIASAGSPYGEIGYQTLSILLIVVVQKTKNDTRIVEHFAEIRKSLPRLDVWQDIYPTDTMRRLVGDAYLNIVNFSRAATEYFTHFWHRLYLAINPLASASFEDIVNGLHRTLAEINAEAMIGLHDTSRTIKKSVLSLEASARDAELDRKKLLADNKQLLEQSEAANRESQRLQLQVEELKARIAQAALEDQRRDRQADIKRLAEFQQLLGVHPGLLGTDFAAVKKVLMEVFPNDLFVSSSVPHTAYLQLHEAHFREIPEYQQWLHHPQSSLFFLSGSTKPEGRKFRYYTHSWLSPAAIYIAEGLVRDNCKFAFFSCHPDIESTHISGEIVLSSLILQILQWRPEVLREKEAHFLATFKSSHHRTKEHMLVDLLGEVLLEMRDLGTVYLVLDRLDCCQSKIDNITNELTRLITVLCSPDFTVKVAIVAETSGGEGNWRFEFLPDHEYATDRVFVVKEYNQRRLTTSETSLPRRPSIWSTHQRSTQSATTV
ncbi:hypothetical protein QBC34DRAFT_331299 [Podospora aff. communis PSN243]|uniref:Uncharacterized protein n=1 Tax=Podospora aff. communis PSN243 TaxID=3040156 RepID=A0AAV9GEG4_9PEZI|nr:hypothetical protein QBC34DRAFT_331299 [Podospora aff. communis PSN243]